MNKPRDFTDTLRQNTEAEIARIAAYAQGEVGVVARHLGNGLELAVAVDDHYPPASAVKMPLAAKLLDMVDRGDIKLSDMIEVRESEMNPAGPLGDEFPHAGIALSVANLLEITITRSCNTATDVLFRVVGGPAKVTEYLKRVGIDDFSVQRTMRVALGVLHEIPLPPDNVSMRDFLRTQSHEVLDARNRTHANYQHDQRDLAKPTAMLELLTRIWNGELLKPATRQLLLEIMSRTKTGDNRFRARLPQGVPFASKSGSGAGTAVDVGYVTLPLNRGTVAAGVFVKCSPLTMAEREAVVADIGRLVYDYYMIAG